MRFFILILSLLTCASSASEYESKFLKINGINIHYVDEGSGDTLLFVHGLSADISRFENNIPALAKTHRVIAIDLPGFGQSQRLKEGHRGAYFVKTIHELLTRLNVENVSIIGNSMGGWVSLLYAQTYPEDVTSMVLIAPAFVFGLPESVDANMLENGANPKTLTQMQSYLERTLGYKDIPKSLVSREFKTHQQNNRGDGIMNIAKSLEKGEDVFTGQSLSQIDTKTLIVHGRNDGVIPVALSEGLINLLPVSELFIIEESGHWPQWDKHNEFNEILLEFLAAS